MPERNLTARYQVLIWRMRKKHSRKNTGKTTEFLADRLYHSSSAVPDYFKYIIIRDSIYETGSVGIGIPGTPVIALLLSTICAMLFLGLPGGFSIKEITNVMTKFLTFLWKYYSLDLRHGMLRFILQEFRNRRIIRKFCRRLTASDGTFVAFLVAAVVRVSVGSATVSIWASGVRKWLSYSVGEVAPKGRRISVL